jgi:hypothetical protein
MDDTDRREIRKYINNENQTLPRRIDSSSVMTATFFQNDTWYMNVTVTLNGLEINTAWKKAIRDYQNKNHCRPPMWGLNIGLTIKTQYFDENENFLFTAKTNKNSCDT